MKGFKIFLLLLGFVLFFLLVYKTGIDVIYGHIVTIRWMWIFILIPFFFVYIFDTLGWKYSFHKGSLKMNYSSLFLTRLAGEAINYITPAAYLGGEPVKAHLLCRKGIPTVEVVSSVIIAKTTMTIAQIIFAIAGITLAFLNFVLPPFLKIGSIVCLLGGTALLLFFMVWQKKGLFIPILKVLKRFNITFLEKKKEKIKSLDNNISEFYQSQKSYFILSTIFHLMGWVVGFIEVYLIVKAVGIDISMTGAFVIESLFVVIKAISFIIPGGVGAQEGGTVLLFSTLGFSATLGLTVGIVKRIRQLFWVVIGLAILAKYELSETKKEGVCYQNGYVIKGNTDSL